MSKNVVLIILDSLRKDYGDAYHWHVLKTKGFKKHDKAIAPSTWTLPSHISMLTGLYPLYHNVHTKEGKSMFELRVPKKIRLLMLQHKLRALGYTTYLFTANTFFHPWFGFEGYDHVFLAPLYFDIGNLPKEEKKQLEMALRKHAARDTKSMIKAALKERVLHILVRRAVRFTIGGLRGALEGWPKEKGISSIVDRIRRTNLQEPFALFINLMEMHDPYTLFPLPNSQMKAKIWHIKYKSIAKYQASKLKDLLEILLEFDPLIIVTSDHGQLLGEHNLFGHGTYPFDELTRVPLYVRFPEDSSTKINTTLWFPLTKVNDLVLAHVRNQKKVVGAEYALSEFFGALPWDKKEKHRIAIYTDEGKGIFNVSTWVWEKKPPNEEVAKKIIIRHLKGYLRFSKKTKL